MTKSIDDVFNLVTTQTVKIDAIKEDVSDLKTDMRDVRSRIDVAETVIEERTGPEATGAVALKPVSLAPATSSKASIRIVQTYLPWILLGLAAIGAWVAASNGDGHDPEQLDRAVERTEDTHETVEALRKLLESVAEHPPASFEANTSEEIPE